MPKYLDQNGTGYLVLQMQDYMNTFLTSKRSCIQLMIDTQQTIKSTPTEIYHNAQISVRGDVFQKTTYGQIQVLQTTTILITGSVYLNAGLSANDLIFVQYIDTESSTIPWATGRSVSTGGMMLNLPIMIREVSAGTVLGINVYNSSSGTGTLPAYFQNNILALEY